MFQLNLLINFNCLQLFLNYFPTLFIVPLFLSFLVIFLNIV